MSTPSSDDETDETDACPICLDPVRHNDTSAHFLCCRKPMCVSCAPIYLQSKFGRHCPLCREELPTTQKEMFEAHLKHARRGHLWAQFNLGVQHAMVSVQQSLCPKRLCGGKSLRDRVTRIRK